MAHLHLWLAARLFAGGWLSLKLLVPVDLLDIIARESKSGSGSSSASMLDDELHIVHDRFAADAKILSNLSEGNFGLQAKRLGGLDDLGLVLCRDRRDGGLGPGYKCQKGFSVRPVVWGDNGGESARLGREAARLAR